ncbi:3'(2'),5'-bisphosphate nucleotidase CysQ [Prochlorococcus sp. AH-716-P08]|nr:3'(2'),5'-bisphosphate nucleotidase CysQ [Prochlorococcus sp. AH-716-P08]
MVKIPFGLDIHNLIDDLRNISWEASKILLYYSKELKLQGNKKRIIKTIGSEDPVTMADLKVNDLIIKRINEKYRDIPWSILTEENVKLKSEFFTSRLKWQWVIDPLDGTKDFIQGTGNYAMHLALNYNQKPYIGAVLIPEKDELWISDGKILSCETSKGFKKKILPPKEKSLNEMILVTSKNHRNKNLEDLVNKINFKEVNIMGSIGCKLASIIRGDSDIYISLSLPGQSCPKDWDFAAPEAILRSFGGAITNLDNEELAYNKINYEQRGIIIASNDKKTHESKCKQIKAIIKEFNLFPIDI